jgi:argininosuccinate lyase
MNTSNKMWGGRFSKNPSKIMLEINQSISFDYRLYKQDIRGSIVHTKMLNKAKIITKNEAEKIILGLQKIEKEIDEDKFQFKKELEDIHMNIENRLKEIIGDVAGKLHTARSRNDQVATDFKLFIRDEIDEIKKIILGLEKNLVKKAEKNLNVIMPGFTHLQVAQPVLFPHHLLAYFEMFKRDISRFDDLRERMNECPLGSCALAGTSFSTDRFFVAKELEFARPTANSMDSVSDRDFAIEFLFCASLTATHLSRLAEEIILWMSAGFNFIELSDEFTSGSSIMPQKKNPDAAELTRAKCGRIFGSLFSLLTTIKALPLTYSKDMQEDKEPIFDTVSAIKLSLQAMSGMILDMKINKNKMLTMSKTGYSTATDLADFLVRELDIPFRNAHHITGEIVKIAEGKKVELCELKLSEMQKVEKNISKKIFEVLSVENSIASKTSYGGTSQDNIKIQIDAAKKFLNKVA